MAEHFFKAASISCHLACGIGGHFVRMVVMPIDIISMVMPAYRLRGLHKVRHAILVNFDPLPLSHFVTHPGTPPKVRHTSRTLPPIFSRPSTKILDKIPLYKFYLNCSQRFLSGGFCPGWFLSVPLMSQYICYNR